MTHNKTIESSQFVTNMLRVGASNQQIAKLLDISEPTFYKHYKEDVRLGRELLAVERQIKTEKVIETLYTLAVTEGDRKACTEWLDRFGGEELQVSKKVEHTGEVKLRPILEIKSALPQPPLQVGRERGGMLEAPPLATNTLETEKSGYQWKSVPLEEVVYEQEEAELSEE